MDSFPQQSQPSHNTQESMNEETTEVITDKVLDYLDETKQKVDGEYYLKEDEVKKLVEYIIGEYHERV